MLEIHFIEFFWRDKAIEGPDINSNCPFRDRVLAKSAHGLVATKAVACLLLGKAMQWGFRGGLS
jgi:hypothetical protein